MSALSECDKDQLVGAVSECTEKVVGWATDVAFNIMGRMERLHDDLADACDDAEARRLFAEAFLDDKEAHTFLREYTELLRPDASEAVGIVYITQEDILRPLP